MDIAEVLKQKRTEIMAIAEKYGAYNIRVFGSVARGQSQEKSDFDFLVKLEPRCRLVDWLHMQEDLKELLGKDVDVVQEEALKKPILERVLKEAVPL